MKAKSGDWVEIENMILRPEERSANLPEDTRNTPLHLWIRGFMTTEEAQEGDEVEITTLAGRTVVGVLADKKPRHHYDFGDTVIELIQIGEELKEQLSKLSTKEVQ